MNLATPKEPREVRMQATFFFQQLCQSRFFSFVFDFVKESCYDFLIWRHFFLYILVSVYTFLKSYNFIIFVEYFLFAAHRCCKCSYHVEGYLLWLTYLNLTMPSTGKWSIWR